MAEHRDPRHRPPRQPEGGDADRLLEDAGHQRERGESVDDVLNEARPRPPAYEFNFNWKPRDIKDHLDRFVIGQDDAKKVLANAVCYHYARVKQAIAGEDVNTVKKNVVMIGPTGAGKTYLVKKVAELVGVPWTTQDATRFTSSGYIGKKVDDMIRELYLRADRNLEAAEYGIVMVDEVDKLRATPTSGKDVNGLEVQNCLLKVLEDTDVDLVSTEDPLVARQATAMREQERSGRPAINTKHVLFIMSGGFTGLEQLVANRMEAYDSALLAEDWRRHVLPEDLVKYGFDPQFIGRLPIRVGLHELTEEHLYRILTESEESPAAQYIDDLASYGIRLSFEPNALKEIAKRAASQRTGARALVTVLERTLEDFLFDLPSTDIKEFQVTEAVVQNPKEAHTLLMGQYQQGQAHRQFADFAKRYQQEHGVKLSFTKDAYARTLQLSKERGKPVPSVLEDALRKFPLALKLFDKNALEVTPELLGDPTKYLQELTRKYTMEQR